MTAETLHIKAVSYRASVREWFPVHGLSRRVISG